jgi:DNA-binding NtrC family response regulator
MTKPAQNASGNVTILSVSPLEEDHLSLQAIVAHSRWRLFKAVDLSTAQPLLDQHEIAVVFCERDLGRETWIDILEHTNTLPRTPSLIVTSRLADERLWSEVLNRNGWDVLAKPYEHSEVVRAVRSAWRHWQNQIKPAQVLQTMRAAS